MFKSESDREVDVGHEILHGLELLGGAKIMKMSSINLFQKGIAQIKVSQMVSM